MTAKLVSAATLAGAALLICAPASATQVINVPLDQMARESRVIVVARVLRQQVIWDDTRSRILTLTEIQVEEGIRGAKAGDSFLIYQVGGSLEGKTMHIAGALRFRERERMVLFAQPFDDMLVSYGMGLGKFTIEYDSGRPMVSPQFGDVVFMERHNGRFVPGTAPVIAPRPLAAFVAEVRGFIGGAR